MKIIKIEDEIDFGKFKGQKVTKLLHKQRSESYKWFKWINTNMKEDIRLHKSIKKEIDSNSKLNLSQEDIDILKNIRRTNNCDVARILLRLNSIYIKSEMRNVKFLKNNNVSFKYALKKGVHEMKIGRMVKYLIKHNSDKLKVNGRYINPDDITPAVIEGFVNNIASYKSGISNFQIVEGEDIRKYYNQNTYLSENGTLGNSCMKYSSCANFFDLYVNNPSQIKMLIQKNGDFIVGRAILWLGVDFGDDIGVKTFMDRIYSINQSTINAFKKYANEKDYVTKYDQAHNRWRKFKYKNRSFSKTLNVSLENLPQRLYPYMDTLFAITSDGKLTNQENTWTNNVKYCLRSTNGAHSYDYIMNNY